MSALLNAQNISLGYPGAEGWHAVLEDFELQLQGEAQQWKLTLIPRSLLLKQVFTQINIDGGELVHTIELLETQGDSTLLRMQDSTASQPLSDAEQHDFAQ